VSPPTTRSELRALWQQAEERLTEALARAEKAEARLASAERVVEAARRRPERCSDHAVTFDWCAMCGEYDKGQLKLDLVLDAHDALKREQGES
jgi:hypothetical protein